MAIFSNGQSTRSRVGRVAQFELGPKRFEQLTKSLQRSGVLGRFIVVLCAAAAMWMINLSWRPPFPYRLSQIPPRDIVTRVSFTQVDVVKTREAKDRARRSIECVYRNDPQPLVELRAALRGRLSRMLNAESAAEFDDVLQEFEMRAEVDPRPGSATDAGSEFTDASANVAAPMESSFSLDNFEGFQAAFAADPRLENLEHELDDAFAEVERFGLLRELQHDVTDGSRSEITIRSATDEKDEPRVALETVRMTEAVPQLKKSLDNTLSTPGLAALIFPWLKPQLPETLTLDRDATRQAERRALEKVSDVLMHFEAGKDVLATAGHPLTSTEMGLLRLEYDTRLQHVTWRESLIRSFGAAGMYLAVFVLCGTYLFWRDSPLLQVTRKFHTLLGLAVTTLGLARVCSQDPWHAELVPLMMFGITVGIAYRHEVAFLLVASICLLVTLGLGQDLAYFVTYAATMASTVFLLKNIRSRTKLVYIGLWAALVAALTTLGVYAIGDGPIDVSWFQLAGWHALLAVVAGMLMTALLPFVEQLMEVQTEISLLELGDVAHPLLQELARRAPGTYNHSMSVASIAQTAAENIGANGLLVRVGAYFHDIGKMLKPQYFIENQEQGASRHDSLLPAMSTLIIIAHVKDGADLARQHHLPQPIVDFVQQHHGTTLVEYFYDRAHKQKEGNPDAANIDEQNFRYPGPRPQTKEAAVLMLADCSESAARCLPDLTPTRIEGLVSELAEKRLLDGQFDECGLTLRELRTVQTSIYKSLVSMYHGRVRYPDQQSA